MEDKMFELMTQIYSEMQTLSKKVDKGFTKLEKDIIRLEDKIDNNSKALFDGYTQTYEKIVTVEEKVDALSAQVEKQDVEIKVVRKVGIN